MHDIALAIVIALPSSLAYAGFLKWIDSKRPPDADLPAERLSRLEGRVGELEAALSLKEKSF